jgi:hypothetical protein
MPVERDDDAEREARIEQMVRELKEVQERVKRLQAEGRRRAAQIARERKKDPPGGER